MFICLRELAWECDMMSMGSCFIIIDGMHLKTTTQKDIKLFFGLFYFDPLIFSLIKNQINLVQITYLLSKHLNTIF
jgi:hypothetical protein